MGQIDRRLARLEADALRVQKRCIHCEQSYWTLVATNRAVGPYSSTEYGGEAGLVFARELTPEDERRTYQEELPHYELDEAHEGIIEAYSLVAESRPPGSGCKCFASWVATCYLEAQILYHYPRVAQAATEALERYASSPLNERKLWHFASPAGYHCPCEGERGD